MQVAYILVIATISALITALSVTIRFFCETMLYSNVDKYNKFILGNTVFTNYSKDVDFFGLFFTCFFKNQRS